MPGFLTPDSQTAAFSDLERRVRALESAQRVGLNRVRAAWSTFDDYPTVWGVWDSVCGAARRWQDDQGTTGTGHPVLTVTTGTRVLMLLNAYVAQYGATGGFRSAQGNVGVGLDGVDPASIPGDTWGWRTAFYNLNDEHDGPAVLATVKTVTPGEHTFQVYTNWVDTAGAGVKPLVSSIVLTIIPLD